MASKTPHLPLPSEAEKEGNDAGHGNRFQSKLLILFAIRAIKFGYQFYLGTELPVGEKFDDLIFHYKDQNDVNFRQQYLQAKHRLNENDPKKQIMANDLLDVKNGDFSLLKYFQSFVKIRSKGNDIEHCIICTNVDFNHKDITEKGIILERVDEENFPKLLDCTDVQPQQSCYKLKDLNNFKVFSSRYILNCIVNCTDEEMKSLFQNCTEVVNGKQFNDHTADEMRLFFSDSQNRYQIEKLVEAVFDHFLDKLIFVVKMPNENEFDDILAKEVARYFRLSNADLSSSYVMNEMVNWFKKQENIWLTAEDAKHILDGKTEELIASNYITSLSIDYQYQLKRVVEFNDSAIDQFITQLKSFWNNSIEKIQHVSSKTPKLTAVKVFSAIKKLPEFPNKDNYLVISSKHLKEKERKVRKSMKVNGNKLLVVVDEDAKNPIEIDSFYESFIREKINQKVIVITSQNFSNKSYDEDIITYGQLHENTKQMLWERQVSFQGINNLTVNGLIDMKQVDKVLDSKLIENLLQMAEDDKIVIPSFNTFSFEKSIYIKRKLKFLSKDQLLNKLADIEEKPNKKGDEQMKSNSNKTNEEFDIDQNGKIKWQIQDEERKKEIWDKLKVLLEQNKSSDLSLLSSVNERELIDGSNKRIIIRGVAGTGKSTILSHYYEKIKKEKLDNLVLKINLMNYSKALKETNNINDFLINNVFAQNAFARSLLKHRLETGDRIILLLDDFDEIDNESQKKIVELVKNLNESIPLYITTRPHMADKLQFELSQLAYSLDKFTEKDQINYLTSFWKEYLKEVSYNEETIKSFAKDLIKRVSETLKDKEKEFIGIPLQCRILAECFQSKIKDEIIREPNTDLSHLIEGQQFDLADLYKSLIDEKQRVFREEKIQVCFGQSQKTENHLRKLAVQTIVYDQEDVDVLIPSGGLQSELERKKEETELNENGIRLGLLVLSDDNGIRFRHKSFAEYILADYIVNGFLLDQNTKLPTFETNKWITEKMLMEDSYKRVRVFFGSTLKDITDSKIQEHYQFKKFVPSLFTFKNKDNVSVIKKAFQEKNDNLLLFLVNRMKKGDKDQFIDSINENLFEQTPDVFQRIVNYFEDPENGKFDDLLQKLADENFWQHSNEMKVNQENISKFLQVLGKREKIRENCLEALTSFFIRNKYYDPSNEFFKTVSSIYPDDSKLAFFMQVVSERYFDNKINGREITEIFRKLGRNVCFNESVLQKYQIDENKDLMGGEHMGKSSKVIITLKK